MISRLELIRLIERLKPYIDKYNSDSGHGKLSFFEIYTALAFEYFKQKAVDFAVLETGLGGRLDATNTVNALVAVITPISYEHTIYLGNTLAQIASEKAGIIKSHKVTKSQSHRPIVISAPQPKEVQEVIRTRCKNQDAILHEIGRDLSFKITQSRADYQRFDIQGIFGKITDLNIRLAGKHQIVNAALAICAVSALGKYYKKRLSLEAIEQGLYNTVWPGRFEIIRSQPWVILDGAQNAASAEALKETLVENFPNGRRILIFGASGDKDIKGMIQALVALSDEVILTQADNPRAADVDAIEQVIRNHLPRRQAGLPRQITKTKEVKVALGIARTKAKAEDVILVTGSLYLVGEARGLLRTDKEKS